LSFLILARVFVICATAAAQVALNAWNGLFYEAIAERNFPSFPDQLLVLSSLLAAFSLLMRRKPGFVK
jgi:putative ATP-binding cassette transporter